MRKSRIRSVKIILGQTASGYKVNVKIYTRGGTQNIMNAWVDYGKASADKEVNVKVIYLKGELTINKIDYDYSTDLEGAEFAICAKKAPDKNGNIDDDTTWWLKPKGNTIEYVKGYSEETKFITGEEYCGFKEKGKIILNNLELGYRYYVFEIESAYENKVEDLRYPKEEKYGWTNSAGISYLSDKEVQRILCGGEWYDKWKDTRDEEDVFMKAVRKTGKELFEVYRGNGKRYRFGYNETTKKSTVNWVEMKRGDASYKYIVRNKDGGVEEDGEFTIRKVDYDNSTLLNGFKFAIFKKNEGWLGYNEERQEVTFSNTWANAYQFETGKAYCKNYICDGEFNLNGLTYGFYYVFEVGTPDGDYSLEYQEGCSRVSGNSLFDNEEWEMKDGDQHIQRVLCGGELWQKNLVSLDMSDGSPYEFRFSDKNDKGSSNYIRIENKTGAFQYGDEERYATKNATFTIKNRKNTRLEIVKKDEESGQPIQGVGVKILLNLREHKYSYNKETGKYEDVYNIGKQGNQDANKLAWYWLKQDRTLTKDVNEAYEFTTNKDGKIILNNIPYGVYRFFETSPAKGYKLSDQVGYMQGKPTSYDENQQAFIEGEYAKLMTENEITVQPKPSTDGKKAVLSGIYTIRTKLDSDYYLGYQDDNNQTNIKLSKEYRSNNFRISYVERGNYLIYNTATGKYVGTGGETYNQKTEGIVYYHVNQAGYPGDNTPGETRESSVTSRYQWTLEDTGETNVFRFKNRWANSIDPKYMQIYGGKVPQAETQSGNANDAKNGDVILIIDRSESNEGNKQRFELISKSEIKNNSMAEDGIREYKEENAVVVTNKPGLVELNIVKEDGSYQADLNKGIAESERKLYLSGAEFKIYRTDITGKQKIGWVQQIKEEDEIRTNYTSYSQATTFTTDDEGKVNITNLNQGKYYIFETKAPKGYRLKDQDGYKIMRDEIDENKYEDIPGASEINSDDDWVYLGNSTADDTTTNIVLSNKKYTSLKGKVWLDNPDGKEFAYNHIYNESDLSKENNEPASKDTLLSGIQVNLYSNKTTEDGGETKQLLATTTTGENGEYVFTEKINGDKLTYWELAYCNVEFIYDNKEYVIARPFEGDNLQINSKAQAKEIITTGGNSVTTPDRERFEGELYDGNLGLEEGKIPGKAVTYQGATEGLDIEKIEENKNANNNEKLLTAFYNEETYTIEDVNLGLIRKIEPTHEVRQKIDYVKIVKGDYEFTYRYIYKTVNEDGKEVEYEAENDNNDIVNQPIVEFQKDAVCFTQKINPTDINYNVVNQYSENSPEEFKVYVVYRIDVINNTTDNNLDLYKEDQLYLTSLKNIYDRGRMQLSKESIGTEAENREFNLWSGENGEAEFNVLNATEQEGNVFRSGIKSGEDNKKQVHIQFKVNQDFLLKILLSKTEEETKQELDEIFKHPPTKVIGTGYHTYERQDKNWKDTNTYKHATTNLDKINSSLFLRFELAANPRTISGNVFEDSKVNQLSDEEEDKRKNERIGNGHRDESEKPIEDVVVCLMDANNLVDGNIETAPVAKLYNGQLTYNTEEGKWKSVSQNAVAKADQNGRYELPGVIPGKYYLKFAYGNGEVVFKDLEGNDLKLENINTKIERDGQKKSLESYSFKSTIITKPGYNENDETWFLKNAENDNKEYSIASDSINEINDRISENNSEIELNYEYVKNLTNKVITANSPVMNVKFTFVDDLGIGHNEAKNPEILKDDCTGMSFGIIERPYVNIELTKKIKNVRLTLQNGTSIVNGDINDANISPYLSRINEGNAKLELDVSYLYGSDVTVTYTLSAHNKSELNYPSVNYYKYGINPDNIEPVTTKVTKIVDYINNQNASYENQSENVTTDIKELSNQQKEQYFSEDAIKHNKYYTQTVLGPEVELWPEVYTANHEGLRSGTEEYEFTVNNLLSLSDQILGWQSYSEIIGIKNRTLTPQKYCLSGNYEVGNPETYEPDTASATISIYSSTGENKNIIICCVVGASLLIIAVGVILIKKYVV